MPSSSLFQTSHATIKTMAAARERMGTVEDQEREKQQTKHLLQRQRDAARSGCQERHRRR